MTIVNNAANTTDNVDRMHCLLYTSNGKLVILNLELETDAQELADVVVVAKKNRENENMRCV